MEKEITTNKMGTEPVGRLMMKMGVPMILSMMLQAFYNIVDSYFVSSMKGIGDAAVNALTLAFPIQTLMVAVGIGTGVGVNSLLSKYLGMGDRESASKIAHLYICPVPYIRPCGRKRLYWHPDGRPADISDGLLLP